MLFEPVEHFMHDWMLWVHEGEVLSGQGRGGVLHGEPGAGQPLLIREKQ